MNEYFVFMMTPTVACLIYPIVFSYFGVHVLKREVIFVDLSLAQLAALGGTVAFVLGVEEGTFPSQLFSFIFVVIGAIFFAVIRFFRFGVSLEAIIGIVYVFGSSVTMLMVSHSPHGGEHIRHLLNGSILWMDVGRLFQLVVVAICLSLVVWKYHSKFVELSVGFKSENESSRNHLTWDLVFYLALGLVVVISLEGAGVYLIFSFLIIPVVCASLFFDTFKMQMVGGSLVGILTSQAGLVVSFIWDLPAGTTVVAIMGGVFFSAIIVRTALSRKTSKQ